MSTTMSQISESTSALSIVLFAGGFDRVHYALVMASAAAATNRKVTLFFTGRALRALVHESEPGVMGWHDLDPADDGSSPVARDRYFAAVGIPPRTFYVMQQRGDGPPVVRVGRRTLIRKAAAEVWLAGQECR